MAFAARNAAPLAEENNVLGLKDAKAAAGKAGQSLLQQGSKRRAPLGDMSNLVAPLNNRTAAAKDGKAQLQDCGLTKPKPTSVRSKSVEPTAAAPTAAAGAPAAAGPTLRPSLVPRTRSQTLAARQQQAGMSMSSLLQTRSEAAVTTRKAPAPPSPLPDIDSVDNMNPLAASEYVVDIYSYYKRAEPKFRVAHDYMQTQADINEKMRAILVDWLEEVHLKFKLMPETLFLTVNLIDRFLAEKQVTRKNLQLVGVTAMLIASKYEEIWAPEVRDFVYISDKAYTRDQILAMEKLMLNTLRFNLTLPTSYNFLARYLKAANMHLDKQVAMLSSYLIELSLVDSAMLKYSYSIISAASAYVAMRALGKSDAYPKTLARHSGYSLEAILPCAAVLVQMMEAAPTNSLNAVYKKYTNAKFLEVAKNKPPMDVLEEARMLESHSA
mmetsp:Transcript_6234/g.13638  ORF Transcript_6234/g.13638 Transcript_6234/m.13638 type:complete len:439 (-) Transcript_6234:738-2054(-)|eukprot:CAMPEP_0202890554 /NCGR_PEP_ID=MMETSP1392-20130828/912_1 /ASSEMBLY_ACC=CAM_ASM_000868 /TAXON_ID=225041 /ORGANISM="Chlamydomonas chlamydogama, Strain SAG 11-48b" /LENGTH=438 /DNA_ID=CAMNT_0049574145 /DNA_START=128 /DNA_END=1444 /DNA_ORIENTATION=+